MKKDLSKFIPALIVLIVTAVFCVTVISGIRLKLDYNNIVKGFDKEAIKTDRHGNCLSNDLSAYVSTAKSFVSYAEGIWGSTDEIAKAKELIKAFDENSSAFYGYGIYTELASVIENINSRLGENGNTSDLAELLSDQAKIKRAYSGDYLKTSEKLDSYLDGFPRSVLAKLFNIGK